MQEEPKPQGADKYLGKQIVGRDGEKIGIADRFINNRLTDVPQWIVVEAGLFGRRKLIVPVAGSTLEESSVRIPYDAEAVSKQPEIDIGNGLEPESEDALNAHFGLGANAQT